MNIDFEKLTEDITTKQDLVYLLDDINQAQEMIYQGEQQELSQKTKGVVSENLRKIFKQRDLNNREQQNEFLKQLKEHLQSIPQVKLTIAFSPSDNFLKETSRWLESEIGERVIIDLTVNPKIVGGAIIEYRGHYLNLTLNKKIEQTTSYE